MRSGRRDARTASSRRRDSPSSRDSLVDVDRPVGHARDRELVAGAAAARFAERARALRVGRAVAIRCRRRAPRHRRGSASSPVSPSTTISGTALTRVATTGSAGEHRLEQHDAEALPARACARRRRRASSQSRGSTRPGRSDCVVEARVACTRAFVCRLERPPAEDREPRLGMRRGARERRPRAASRGPSARSGGRSRARAERRPGRRLPRASARTGAAGSSSRP